MKILALLAGSLATLTPAVFLKAQEPNSPAPNTVEERIERVVNGLLPETLSTIMLSSFAGAPQDSGKAWWPQFRGPNSSGLGEGRPPVHFGPDHMVLWKAAVGAGLSSPIIWEGRIFLTEFDGANQQLATLCIDRRTGKILWRRTVAPGQIEKVHAISSPAGATPATDGERVYVYFGSYGLVCYDLDGNQKWERRLPLLENT
jgi:outer membrane protein assembly factor BamB